MKSLIGSSTSALFLLLLIFSVATTLEAAEPKVLFIKSGSASVYNKIINAAKKRIDHICDSNNKECDKPSISVESVNNNKKLDDLVSNTKWDLVVTVGNMAAMRLNSYKIKTPVLYTLIPSHSYPTIRKKSSSKNKSAIYIDQPIKRQLQLIKSAMPDKDKVGVLLGSYSGIGKKQLQQVIRNMGLKPVVVNVNNGNIGSTLENNLYHKVDVLLAQPDPSVYNKKTVMTVLLSSYRHNVPVFGYSAAFVKSGATAAIYSSPMDMGQHIGDEVAKFAASNNRSLPPPAFPRYFSVNTNRRVARSLKINLPPTNEIKAKIMQAR